MCCTNTMCLSNFYCCFASQFIFISDMIYNYSYFFHIESFVLERVKNCTDGEDAC